MPEVVSTGEPPLPDDVSALLRAWTDGDQRALARLTPIVYDELHRLAHYYLKRERAGHSLQTTALVNEAYLRLVDYKRMHWQNRAHFVAAAAQSMCRSTRTPSCAPIAPMISCRSTRR
jgi:RNA polymerase sigma-70 factor, ECF subfamily